MRESRSDPALTEYGAFVIVPIPISASTRPMAAILVRVLVLNTAWR